MADDLNALFREIHRLRRFARDLQEGIDRYPRALKSEQGRVLYAEQQLKDEQEALKKLKVTQHQREVDLKTREGQLERSRKKLSEAASQKEFDALNSEIAQGQQACGQLEEEILTLMGVIEERTAGLPKFEQNLATIREEYRVYELAATAKKTEQETLLKQALIDLAEIEKKMPPAMRDQYLRCVKARGADALAVARDQSCGACSTGITAQQIVQLRNNQYVDCHSCGRIFYLPAPAPQRGDAES